MTECNDLKEQRRHNTGLAKVAVQSSADTFVVNQSWFSASTFVVKIATCAKPETVIKKRHKIVAFFYKVCSISTMEIYP